MKKLFSSNLFLMFMSVIVFIGGYLFIRIAYHFTDSMPFAQEIVLIVLGTLATILITAMLLNKQTSVELDKEQSIKFIELKTETYQRLIDTIEEIVASQNITSEMLNKLRFNSHRLAIFASPSVLDEYQNFLNIFNQGAEDNHVSLSDAERISEALAKLTVYIRSDLLGELDKESRYSTQEINAQIMENAKNY
jgi:type II secretory pathway pseudopilin PulG